MLNRHHPCEHKSLAYGATGQYDPGLCPLRQPVCRSQGGQGRAAPRCVSGSLVGAHSRRILNAWKPCVKPSSYQLACTVERSSACSVMLPALVRRQRSARRRGNKSSRFSSETPEQAGVPVTNWSHGLLAQTVTTKGIAQSISPAKARAFFKRQPLYSHTAVAIGNIPTLMIGTSLPRKARGNLYAVCHCHRAVCNIRRECR
jgi:hypothetical protein